MSDFNPVEMANALRMVSLPVEIALAAGTGAVFGFAHGGEDGKKLGTKVAAALFTVAELAPYGLQLLVSATGN